MSNIREYMAIKDALLRLHGMKVDGAPEIEVDCFTWNSTLIRTFDDINPAMVYFYDTSKYYEMVVMYIRGVPVKRHYRRFRDIFLYGQTHMKGGVKHANCGKTRKRIF